MKKLVTKVDIVIPAGTELVSLEGHQRKYQKEHYEAHVVIGKVELVDVYGSFILGLDPLAQEEMVLEKIVNEKEPGPNRRF